MRANGVNLLSIVGAPFGAAFVLAGLLVVFNNVVLPESNHRLANLMADVGRKRPTATITEGVFVDDFVGYSIFVEKVNDRTNEIRGVKIYAEDTADYLELLLRRYLAEKGADDTFTSFVGRLDVDELARFAAPTPAHGRLR
jgi:lipopolysaccharide export LptBFGC system permease protein LptF